MSGGGLPSLGGFQFGIGQVQAIDEEDQIGPAVYACCCREIAARLELTGILPKRQIQTAPLAIRSTRKPTMDLIECWEQETT